MKQRKALFITPPTTTKTSTGGGQRSQLIFASLRDLFKVDVLIIGEKAEVAHGSEFEGAGQIMAFAASPPANLSAWQYLKPIHPRLIDTLARTLARRHLYRPEPGMRIDLSSYDLVVGRYLSPLARAGALEDGKNWTTILDADDLEERDILSRFNAAIPLKTHERLFLLLRLRVMHRIQARLFPRIDHVWLVSPDDRHYIDHPSVSVLPNIPFPATLLSGTKSAVPVLAQGDETAAVTFLFVGVAAHRPNVSGVRWFITKCWPRIVESIPGAEFRIVGSGDWQGKLSDLTARPRVKIVGRVKDLATEYAKADLCICPVFDGAGTKIKVLEALNYGSAVVSTRHSVYGFVPEVVDAGIAIADFAPEFAKICIRLIENANDRQEMAQAGRAAVQEHYSYDAFRRIVRGDLEGLGMMNGTT